MIPILINIAIAVCLFLLFLGLFGWVLIFYIAYILSVQARERERESGQEEHPYVDF